MKTMNLKKIGFGVAAVVTITSGITLADAPAQAFSLSDNPLTGTLAFDVNGLIKSIDSTLVDFDDPTTDGNDNPTILDSSRFHDLGSFTGITEGSIKDLPILGSFPSGGINDFISITDGTNTVNFDLITLTNEQFNPSNGVFQADLRGIFRPTNQPNGGQFDIGQFRLTTVYNTGTIEITPVPTPALLPGIIGMAAATMRKKKKKELA